MPNNRDDFSEKTKDRLAKRVGYRCSNPNCRKLTCGASENVDSYVNVGEAAHICAAAPGGKRYDKHMTQEERKSILNGIWLCRTCAKLIDSDELRYTVELLYQWKHEAEEKTIRDLEQYGGSEVDLPAFYNKIKTERNYEEFLDFLSAMNREVDKLLFRMEEIREKMEAAEMDDDRIWADIYQQRFDSLRIMYHSMNHQIHTLMDEGRRLERQLRDLHSYAGPSDIFSSFGHSGNAVYCIDSVDVQIDSMIRSILPQIYDMHRQMNHFVGEVRGLHKKRIEIENMLRV